MVTLGHTTLFLTVGYEQIYEVFGMKLKCSFTFLTKKNYP